MKHKFIILKRIIKRIGRKRLILCMICLVIFILSIYAYQTLTADSVIHTVLAELSVKNTKAFNEATYSFISDNKNFSDRCFNAKYSSNGTVESYTVDTSNLIYAEEYILEAFESQVKKHSVINGRIPAGTLSRINYFSGKGFDVNIKAYVSYSINSNTYCTAESLGINQVSYKVHLDLNLNCDIIVFGNHYSHETVFSEVIAEKIVMGNVPFS